MGLIGTVLIPDADRVSLGADVAAGVSRAAAAVAAGDLALRGHAESGPELRLRPRACGRSRRRSGVGSISATWACGHERRRAGSRRHLRALHRGVRAVRLSTRGVRALLRPGRGDADGRGRLSGQRPATASIVDGAALDQHRVVVALARCARRADDHGVRDRRPRSPGRHRASEDAPRVSRRTRSARSGWRGRASRRAIGDEPKTPRRDVRRALGRWTRTISTHGRLRIRARRRGLRHRTSTRI